MSFFTLWKKVAFSAFSRFSKITEKTVLFSANFSGAQKHVYFGSRWEPKFILVFSTFWLFKECALIGIFWNLFPKNEKWQKYQFLSIFSQKWKAAFFELFLGSASKFQHCLDFWNWYLCRSFRRFACFF